MPAVLVAQLDVEVRKRILIVDNEDSVRAVFRRLLEEAGYDTATTWSGIKALGLLTSRRFDVVLVDDYLADVYVGDFLERVWRLRTPPRVVVMQAKPKKIEVELNIRQCA